MAELSESETIFIILTSSAGMLLLVGAIGIFILFYQKRMFKMRLKNIETEQEYEQNMIKAQLKSQEQERNRIGADLHDSLGSLLWAAKINSSFIQRTTDLQGEAKKSYDELIQILDQSIESVRRISWELTPEAFQYIGFSKSVEKLCQRFNQQHLTVSFTEMGTYNWNNDDAIHAYRIIQELVSNSIKHANATLLNVSIQWMENRLLIFVQDNGIGFTLDGNRTGVGWWNIQQRIKRLNAQISMGIPPTHQGSRISIIIPLEHGTEKNQRVLG